LARGIVDKRQTGHFTAGVKLDAHWYWLGVGHRALQDDREGITPPDGGFPFGEQSPRSCRMARCERTLFGIYDKDHTHVPFRVPRLRG
jgi:hypothetical protein